MVRRGRKKLLRLDLEGRSKLFSELKTLLVSRLGKKRWYVLILSYEGEPTGEQTSAHSNTIANLTPKAPLDVWKTILVSLISNVQRFVQEYNLTQGIQGQPEGVQPKPPQQ